jgi:hypothetical protein
VSRYRPKQASASHLAQELVSQSLDRIAAILIRAGLDLPLAEALLRRAFIAAAAKTARASHERVTQSHIASLAGVSRLEVRHCLAGTHQSQTKEHRRPRSRVERLIAGWTEDERFQNRQGRPKALTIRGAQSEFDALVRKYGRDVTAKTMRVRLIALGVAKEKGGTLCLVNPRLGTPAAASADLRYIASQLKSIDFELGRRAYQTRRVILVSRDRKSLLAMQRIASARLETVLNSLASMSSGSSKKKDSRLKAQPRLLVSSTIAIESED